MVFPPQFICQDQFGRRKWAAAAQRRSDDGRNTFSDPGSEQRILKALRKEIADAPIIA